MHKYEREFGSMNSVVGIMFYAYVYILLMFYKTVIPDTGVLVPPILCGWPPGQRKVEHGG